MVGDDLQDLGGLFGSSAGCAGSSRAAWLSATSSEPRDCAWPLNRPVLPALVQARIPGRDPFARHHE